MVRAVADTHTVLWYLYNDARLSLVAGQVLDAAIQAGEEIAVSSISLIEIAYLIERGRVPSDAFDRVVLALNTVNTGIREVPVNQRIADVLRQIDRAQIPDMPDRIIAATGLWLSVPVISRDGKIQSSAVPTIW